MAERHPSRAGERIGRARRYGFAPVSGFAHAFIAHAVAALEEASARHFDLISTLPDAILQADPGRGFKCIASCTAHMIWAEAMWLCEVTGHACPDRLAETLERGQRNESPPSLERLIEALEHTREDITYGQLMYLEDIDEEFSSSGHIISVRGLLMHLIWHWTYHTGQCSYFADADDRDYIWTFEDRIVGWHPKA